MGAPVWTMTIDFRGERREIEYEYQDGSVSWWFMDMSQPDFDALKITVVEDDAIIQEVHRAEYEERRYLL